MNDQRKTIVLVEPHIYGHRETYLLELTLQFAAKNCNVVILTMEAESVSNSISLLNLSTEVSVYKIPPILNENIFLLKKFQMQFPILNFWWRVRKKIKKISAEKNIDIDLVFFPWLDDYVFDMGKYLSFVYLFFPFFFPFKWSGLYFHPILVEKKWRQVTNFLKIKNLIAICILDEFQLKKLKTISAKPVIVLPDFTNPEILKTDILANEINTKARGRKIVTLTGSLQKRKGLLTLLDAAQFSLKEDWFFVFAGELFETDFTKAELSRLNYAKQNLNNCYFHFNRIEKEETINAIINISDIIYAAYIDFPHSSNMLTKAAYFKKPLIVSEGYCMGNRVNNFSLGIAIPEGNINKTIEGINYLLNGYTYKTNNQFTELHSIQTLNKSMSELIGLI